MVSTCLFNIAFAYKDLQGQGEEWSMEKFISMKKHVQHSMHLENSKESCKQLLVLKTSQDLILWEKHPSKDFGAPLAAGSAPIPSNIG